MVERRTVQVLVVTVRQEVQAAVRDEEAVLPVAGPQVRSHGIPADDVAVIAVTQLPPVPLPIDSSVQCRSLRASGLPSLCSTARHMSSFAACHERVLPVAGRDGPRAEASGWLDTVLERVFYEAQFGIVRFRDRKTEVVAAIASEVGLAQALRVSTAI